jgi:hypothetical protein
LEKQSEAKRVSPTLSKLEVKQIGVLRKFVAKTKWSEVKPFKIVPDQSKRTFSLVIVKKRKNKKNEASFFFNKAKKNEYNRSSTIKDLPLLVSTTLLSLARLSLGSLHSSSPPFFIFSHEAGDVR